MLDQKIPITGKIIRIDGKKIIVRQGDAVYTYHTDYYRVVAEEEPLMEVMEE